MFVAFSAWLLRVLCVYILLFAKFVPTCFGLPKSPFSAKMSILGDKMTIIGGFSIHFLAYLDFFSYLCTRNVQQVRK